MYVKLGGLGAYLYIFRKNLNGTFVEMGFFVIRLICMIECLINSIVRRMESEYRWIWSWSVFVENVMFKISLICLIVDIFLKGKYFMNIS